MESCTGFAGRRPADDRGVLRETVRKGFGNAVRLYEVRWQP